LQKEPDSFFELNTWALKGGQKSFLYDFTSGTQLLIRIVAFEDTQMRHAVQARHFEVVVPYLTPRDYWDLKGGPYVMTLDWSWLCLYCEIAVEVMGN